MKKGVQKKAGIKDIAAKAGVSIGTVDRVLHNRGEVKEETRTKILDIVNEMGYTPNIFAKSLSSKKTTRIAIIIPDSSDNNPYWEKPVEGIKMASDELQAYNVEVIYEHFDASDQESYRRVLQKVFDQNPDGIVLNPVFKPISLQFIRECDQKGIPYVFIDVDLEGTNKLGYFGQDAEQSGRVAAKLMMQNVQNALSVLIVKQSNKKVFSQHIESRIQGFTDYLSQNASHLKVNITTLEIDLLLANEPRLSLSQVLTPSHPYNGIFVPNSRVFLTADYIEQNSIANQMVIGFDLLEKSVAQMRKGNITYLISQKPEVQAYKAIWSLFHFLASKKKVNKTNYSAIDVIMRENLDYYYESNA